MQGKVRVSDPQAVERALEELRQASVSAAGAPAPAMRAMVLNLVAYAGDPATADEMARWAAALAPEHPSRGIFLGTTPGDGAGEWDIWVWARCFPAMASHVVCFEAIQVMARSRALERIPAIVLSLLVRDLPVVLWWPGDVPLSTPFFERLLTDADQLVVDTASASDPEDLLRRLAALGHAEHCPCAARDLNWDRLTPWRELVAQFFDAPDCRPCLERVEYVRLEYGGGAGRPDVAQAYLLAAWLATRLGWAPAPTLWSETPEGARANLLQASRTIGVEFVRVGAQAFTPGASAVARGESVPGSASSSRATEAGGEGLRGLTLRALHPEGPATFSIQCSADGAQAEVIAALPNREARRRIVPFPRPTPAELLGQELRRMGFDPIYEEALRMAAFLSSQRRGGGA